MLSLYTALLQSQEPCGKSYLCLIYLLTFVHWEGYMTRSDQVLVLGLFCGVIVAAIGSFMGIGLYISAAAGIIGIGLYFIGMCAGLWLEHG